MCFRVLSGVVAADTIGRRTQRPAHPRRWSVERFRTLILAQPRERLPRRLGPRRKLKPDVRRALVDAPAIGESRDEEQSTASDVLRTSCADLVLEPAALVDHLAADDVLVELNSEDDLATSVL